MFYYVNFTQENVEICKRKLQESELEICYNATPNQPILVAQHRIFGDPLTFRKYLNTLPSEKVKRCELQADVHRQLNLSITFIAWMIQITMKFIKRNRSLYKKYLMQLMNIQLYLKTNHF
ncbi:hypothetical protein PS15p_211571 [Mucor circinelloides]